MAREAIKTAGRSAKSNIARRTEVPIEAGGPRPMTSIDADRRRALIAEAAYYRSRRRVSSGSEIDDWLAAEHAVDAGLMAPASS
jgi:type IV pilus biogenesis protein CpaD/CtpE